MIGFPGLVAQWIEQVPTKFLVAGSSPAEPTTAPERKAPQANIHLLGAEGKPVFFPPLLWLMLGSGPLSATRFAWSTTGRRAIRNTADLHLRGRRRDSM
jgi:hypothetical protein